MRSYLGLGVLFALLWVVPAEGAKPNAVAPNLPPVDADQLPSGNFTGTLVSLPNTEWMFTLKITYPTLQLKPGARMPRTGSGTVRHPHVQNMQRQFQQIQQLQAQMVNGMNHHQAIHNMMQMQQAMMQMQMNQARLAQHEMQMMQRIEQQQVRAQQQIMQQELRLIQQQVRAIQNMYQVVQVTRNFDFQMEENVKVRLLELPPAFDDKGNIKKYTSAELRDLKGKNTNLPGYESLIENLKVGQVVQVVLRVHSKSPSVGVGSQQDKDKDVGVAKDKDVSHQRRMQVRLIVIVKDTDDSGSPTSQQQK